MIKLAVLAILCIPSLAFSQESLNLDFEYALPNTSLPVQWRIVPVGYQAELDSLVKVSSSRSLRIQSHPPITDQTGGFANSFPVDLVKGKTIEFKGKIKTKELTKGYAGLWWRVDGEKGTFKVDDMADRGVRGNQDWTDASIKMKIPLDADAINFGAVVKGQGTAWFDNFEIWIEGKQLLDLPPRLTPPTQEELAWLKKYLYPLKTVEPGTAANQDLQVLRSLIGEAKVVALGEVSHGSREIFKMKHRLIQYLAENKNFDIFSLEANMPEAYRLNEYTIETKGNPSDLIKGMYFWTWSTQEVLDLVEWMKTHNQSPTKMQFTGLDMQFYFGPIRELELAFRDEKLALQTIAKLEKELAAVAQQNQNNFATVVPSLKMQEIGLLLGSMKQLITSSTLPATKKEWLLENTRLLEQYLDNNTVGSRDKFMAENLLWIKAQHPTSKIAVWAHNGHIKKSGHSMGKYLTDSLGKDYLTIGFAFHKGSYTAVGDKGLSSYPAQESYVGTYEYFFKELKEPIFVLDLRAVKQDKSEHGKWLRQKLEFRRVGAGKEVNEFTETNLTSDFDLLIFINESTSSHLLK